MLTKDEDLESFFKDQYKSVLEEDTNPEAYFENIIYNIREGNPKLIKEVRELPHRIRVNRKIKSKHGSGVLIYAKKEMSRCLDLDTNYKFKSLTPDNYLKIFEVTKQKILKKFQKILKKYIQAVRGLFKKSYVVALDKGKKRKHSKNRGFNSMQDVKYSHT